MLTIFAEALSTGELVTVAGTLAGGCASGGTAIGFAIRWSVGKIIDLRREERKYEVANSVKLSETFDKIQSQAADSSSKAFDALIEIQRETIKAMAEVSGSVRELNATVNELRAELIGRQEKRKRPRVANKNEESADNQE
jgi:hypothetical protein